MIRRSDVGRREFVYQRDILRANGYAVTTYEYLGGHSLTPELLDRVRQWLGDQRQ